ncbi:hypothetical protein [Arthrobacter woluwensis]|uniref:Uncharacterized protein n=1 Tax=Arthrobacter woluwensis TaxID=156980 RepID=A0A1H4I7T4_9MICC|nr:hypothetical protein [Arthrobacter woluwensis]SEB29960.1 hypothetical protein SAMN04489745_0096 [Arthrobacter woluwensis]
MDQMTDESRRRDRQLRIWIAEAALSAIGAVALAFLIASPLYVTAHDLAGRALWLVVLFAAVLYFYSIARAFVLGYHAVHDAAELQLGEKVWHLTSSEELVQQVRATGRVHLDIEKTRWPARVKYRSRPWKLPKKAAFVFLDQPTDKDQWLNLSDKRARYLLEIDAAAIQGPVMQRDNALALLHGLRGSARVVDRG